MRKKTSPAPPGFRPGRTPHSSKPTARCHASASGSFPVAELRRSGAPRPRASARAASTSAGQHAQERHEGHARPQVVEPQEPQALAVRLGDQHLARVDLPPELALAEMAVVENQPLQVVHDGHPDAPKGVRTLLAHA
jgi:hypothetical protein